MKHLALMAIVFYKRFISPFKRFSCAYRVYTGHASCSTLGYRAVRLYGFLGGIRVLRNRLAKCGIAHRRYSLMPTIRHKQAGYCDVPCDLPCDIPAHLPCEFSSCDLHGHHLGSSICDVLSGCTPCDCGDWRSSRKKRDEEQWVHIPPSTKHLSGSKQK